MSKESIMNTFVRLLLITLCSTALLTPHVQAETLTWRVYNYVTALHVMPIGFEKVPANVLLERRGIAEFPNGETAAYLTRGSAKMTPSGGTAEGYALYTFDDGSTLHIKWQANSKLEPGEKHKTMSGSGNYLSGTGRFNGIEGSVTIQGKYITPYSKKDGTLGDMIVDVTSNHTVPTR
jgi:hypothetical protein